MYQMTLYARILIRQYFYSVFILSFLQPICNIQQLVVLNYDSVLI